jgi:hypothetical protein
MNSLKSLPVLSALAALVVLALVASPAVAGSVAVALGFVAIFAADYNRALKPLTPRAAVLPFQRPLRSATSCAQAA